MSVAKPAASGSIMEKTMRASTKCKPAPKVAELEKSADGQAILYLVTEAGGVKVRSGVELSSDEILVVRKGGQLKVVPGTKETNVDGDVRVMVELDDGQHGWTSLQFRDGRYFMHQATEKLRKELAEEVKEGVKQRIKEEIKSEAKDEVKEEFKEAAEQDVKKEAIHQDEPKAKAATPANIFLVPRAKSKPGGAAASEDASPSKDSTAESTPPMAKAPRPPAGPPPAQAPRPPAGPPPAQLLQKAGKATSAGASSLHKGGKADAIDFQPAPWQSVAPDDKRGYPGRKPVNKVAGPAIAQLMETAVKAAPPSAPPPSAQGHPSIVAHFLEKAVKATPPASPPPAAQLLEKAAKATPPATPPAAAQLLEKAAKATPPASPPPAAQLLEKAAKATPPASPPPAAQLLEKAAKATAPASPPPAAQLLEKAAKATPPASPPPAAQLLEKAAKAKPPASPPPAAQLLESTVKAAPPAVSVISQRSQKTVKDSGPKTAPSPNKVAKAVILSGPEVIPSPPKPLIKVVLTDIQRTIVKNRREQKRAALRVRKAILSFRHATVENMADLHQAMDAALHANLNSMGTDTAKVQDECERALLLVYQRLEEPLRQRENHEKKKREEILRVQAEQQEEAARVETEARKVLRATQEAKQKVAEAVEAGAAIAEASRRQCAAVEDPNAPLETQVADGEASSADVVLASVQAAELAVRSALEAAEHASQVYLSALQDMGNAPAALKRRSLPDFQAVKKEVPKIRLVLKRLTATAAAAREQAEETVRLHSLLKFVRDAVGEAESSVTKAAEAGAELLLDIDDLSSQELVTSAQDTEETVKSAQLAMKEALRAIVEKGSEMGQTPAAVEMKQGPLFQSLQIRFTGLKAILSELAAAAKAARVQSAGKVAMAKNGGQELAAFSRYDLDGDGFLSRSEVVLFAQEAHKITLTEEQLNGIARSVAPDAGLAFCIPPGKFKRLCAMVSIERSVARACEEKEISLREEERKRMQHEDEASGREEAALRLARSKQEAADKLERERQQRTAELLDAAANAEEALLRAEEFCERAMEAASRLHPDNAAALAGDDSEFAQAILAVAEEVEADVHAGRSSLEACRALSKTLVAARGVQLDSTEVAECLRDLRLPLRMKQLRSAFEKAAGDAEDARRSLGVATRADLAILHSQVACCIRGVLKASGRTGEELFDKACTSEEGLNSEEFVQFVRGLEPGLAADERHCCAKFEDKTVQLQQLFVDLTGRANERLGRHRFLDALTQLAYRVVQDTAMTKENAITGKAGLVRRLRAGESLQALSLEDVDKNTGLRRVQCRAHQDGAEGWVTIMSNLGTTFLEPVAQSGCASTDHV